MTEMWNSSMSTKSSQGELQGKANGGGGLGGRAKRPYECMQILFLRNHTNESG